MKQKEPEILNKLQLETYVSSKYKIDPESYTYCNTEESYHFDGEKIIISFSHNPVEIKEDMVAGDVVYNPQHKKIFSENELKEAYKAALKVKYNIKESIIEYISTYGLPVSDAVVYTPESQNFFKDFKYDIFPKSYLDKDDFRDANLWCYTKKAFYLFNKMVHLKYKLQKNNQKSDTDEQLNPCSLIKDIICIMQCYERNIFYNDIKRTSKKNNVLKSFFDTRSEHYDICRTISAQFIHYIYQTEWWDTKSLPSFDQIIKPMNYSANANNSHYYYISSDYNYEQTALLLKILMTVISVCKKNNCTLRQFAETDEIKVFNGDIIYYYNENSKFRQSSQECIETIYKTAEIFYYDLLSDIILECSPITEKTSDNKIIYSYHFPNLLHALFYMLYKDTDNLKECIYCHRLFPSASLRSDAKYCSVSCGSNYRQNTYRNKHGGVNPIA